MLTNITIANTRSRDEDLDLCPICDDVCTCGQQQSSSVRTADSTSASSTAVLLLRQSKLYNHRKGSDKRARTSNSNSSNTSDRSSFIWDFNVRGQLIPLADCINYNEEVEDDNDDQEEESAESYMSTDAECSDLVSASGSDHLSDYLSESDVEADDDGNDEDFMIYVQDSSALARVGEDGQGNAGSIASITPQVLAAISKALESTRQQSQQQPGLHNPGSTHLLLLSSDGESSCRGETGDSSQDIDMIIVDCDSSTSDNGDSACENSSDECSQSDASEGDSQSEESESESMDLFRFKRVPVNAFYRRSKLAKQDDVMVNVNALRPFSRDPQVAVAHDADVIDLYNVEIGGSPGVDDQLMEEDSAVMHDVTSFGTIGIPLIY